ncbi:MAG: Crp/Fnr family transcriptional regulator [Clostridia bacterium]|nr:Crp/Fnr family transcriptional regulator [Clostridia bacterium]
MDTKFNKKNFIENFKNNCNRVQVKKFSKGETVTTYIEKRSQICIVVSGEVDLIRYDFNGNKTIIGHFVDNEIFGEVFYPANTNNELFAIAHKNSEVLFYNYDSLSVKCKKNCEFHKELTNSLRQLFLDKIVELNLRIELLTTKSTREKILSYFRILSKGTLRRTFTLPYSYTDLADFLSVDRSAMMRELKLLIDDGFIKKNGNKITLLY